MTATPERIAALRSAIASDAYVPDLAAVAESVVAWIARPEQFDRFKPKGQLVESSPDDRNVDPPASPGT